MSNIDVMMVGQKLKKLYRNTFMHIKNKWKLTQVEIDILLFLSNNPHHNTAKEIVELRGLSKSQVSQAIEKLVSRGYVSTEINAADRRYAHLRLCPPVQPICRCAQEAQRTFYELLLTGVSSEDRAQLLKIFKHIMINLEIGTQNVD